MPSVGLVLLVTVLCSYGYAEGIQHCFRRVQDISPDKEVSADPPSPYKLTYRLISRREFEKLADRPWQPLELQKTPAPVKRLYAVRREFNRYGGKEDITLYMHTLGNLVVKDEVGRAYEFLGHFRSPFTGELYTFFSVIGQSMAGGIYGLHIAPPGKAIFSRGKLLKNICDGALFLSPDGRYILQTGEEWMFFLAFIHSYRQCWPSYKEEYCEAPSLDESIPRINEPWWSQSLVFRPTLFDLQSPDLQEIETREGDNKEIESLFSGWGCRHDSVSVWGVKSSPTSFILEIKVIWSKPCEGCLYDTLGGQPVPLMFPQEEPMYEKTYYLLFSLDDSGSDLDGSGLD